MRRWEHGGAWAPMVKAYTCRLCGDRADQSLQGMEADGICPWCAQSVGIRICEGLNEVAPANMFRNYAEHDAYCMARNRSHISASTRAEVMRRDGGVCNHCGSTENPHLDHKLPASRGGLPTAENLWVLCKSCNVSKRNRTVDEWLALGGNRRRTPATGEAQP
jgi:5-methylcytosine-specific restriction endonuclease McrA